MASVALDFTPPDWPNLAILRIFEGPSKDGPFAEIEEVTAVGTYGNYITRYTTNLATNTANWFTVEWEDTKGAVSPKANAIQGGTNSLIGELVARVMLRDPDIDENVAKEEAAAVAELYFGVDPYTVDLATVKYAELSGLTLLAMVRAYVVTANREAGEDYTAGLVSQKSSSKSKFDLDKMVEVANGWLGTGYSVIGVLEDLPVAGGLARVVSVDQSRLIYEIE